MRQPDSTFGRTAFWIFLSFTALYLGITRGHFVSTDEVAVYQQARSVWENGDLSTAPILNTLPGRDGKPHAPYNAGQSIAALPLYGLGKAVRHALEQTGRQDWLQTFAGPVVGSMEDRRWGGDVEICFVNLFNCFVTALLCALYFAFALRLGAAPTWALAATVMLGLTSHVVGFSTSFFQHSAEALFLLWSFCFLFRDTQRPGWRRRMWAGWAAAAMLLVRFPSVITLPALTAYLMWGVWRRRPDDSSRGRTLAWTFAQLVAFGVAVVLGVGLNVLINYWKFGTPSLAGSYAQLKRFDSPLLVSLYGFLLSPGESIFLFTPLLALAPWYMASFSRRWRTERFFLLLVGASYLLF